MQKIFWRICQANEKLTFNLKFQNFHNSLGFDFVVFFYNKKHKHIFFYLTWVQSVLGDKSFYTNQSVPEFKVGFRVSFVFFLSTIQFFCFVLLSKILGHQSLKNSESIRSILVEFFFRYITPLLLLLGF